MTNLTLKELDLQKSNIAYCKATIVDRGGSAPRDIGAKMLVLADGSIFGSIGGGNLEQDSIEFSKNSIIEKKSTLKNFNLSTKTGQCCGGVISVFFEVFSKKRTLHIFGAGHVTLALLECLDGTPFHSKVYDERTEWISKAQPVSDETVLLDRSQIDFKIDQEDFVIIQTHDHSLDYHLIKKSLHLAPKFLGLIGSNQKWNNFKKKLFDDDFSKEEIDFVTCPIGLVLAGKAPKEVAISTLGQLLDKHYNA